MFAIERCLRAGYAVALAVSVWLLAQPGDLGAQGFRGLARFKGLGQLRELAVIGSGSRTRGWGTSKA
jgi:hypothetical protein